MTRINVWAFALSFFAGILPAGNDDCSCCPDCCGTGSCECCKTCCK